MLTTLSNKAKQKYIHFYICQNILYLYAEIFPCYSVLQHIKLGQVFHWLLLNCVLVCAGIFWEVLFFDYEVYKVYFNLFRILEKWGKTNFSISFFFAKWNKFKCLNLRFYLSLRKWSESNISCFSRTFLLLEVSGNSPTQSIVWIKHALWFIIIFANSNFRVISPHFSNFVNWSNFPNRRSIDLLIDQKLNFCTSVCQVNSSFRCHFSLLLRDLYIKMKVFPMFEDHQKVWTLSYC